VQRFGETFHRVLACGWNAQVGKADMHGNAVGVEGTGQRLQMLEFAGVFLWPFCGRKGGVYSRTPFKMTELKQPKANRITCLRHPCIFLLLYQSNPRRGRCLKESLCK
jgi:hypothetical protein